MFMFRNKRNTFVKRLWKVRASRQNETHRTSEEGNSPEDLEIKAVAQAMLKRLQETQLELLVQAVESKGGDISACVLVPKGDVRLGRHSVAPHVLCCQIWRWPDLRQQFELKRLACCGSAKDPVYICCNPFHWSRLCKPESPPPPSSRFAIERLRPEDRAPSEAPVSQETGGTQQYGSTVISSTTGGETPPRRHWCNLAYWELRTRVGRQFPVHRACVNVFSQLPRGDGLCLATLAEQHTAVSDTVRRTREKIGQGLMLSQEEGGVWMYNRSDSPIFVNSPTLDSPNSRTLMVFKVLPGYSIKIFDYDKSKYFQHIQDPELLDGPFDPNAVRISFAKGWGPKYCRQFITSCPCWLEVLLVPCR